MFDFQRKQCWRLLTAPFSHQSFLHLALNSTTLWSCRVIEKTYGSFFFIRYSLVLIVAENLISLLSIFYIRRAARTNSQLQILSHSMSSLQSFGCSGMVLGWLAFLSFYNGHLSENKIMLLGFFHVPIWYSPLIMLLAYHICLLKGNLLYNWAGLCSGYLLAAGILRVLPDFYWSICFILDLGFIVLASIVAERAQQPGSVNNSNRSTNSHSDDDLIEVVALPAPPDRGTAPVYRTVDTTEFDVEEVKTESQIVSLNNEISPSQGIQPINSSSGSSRHNRRSSDFSDSTFDNV